MIVVSVLYPSGLPLDMDYYRDEHLPLVRGLLAPMGALRDDGCRVGGGCRPRAGDRADIANFTAAVPVVLVGEKIRA